MILKRTLQGLGMVYEFRESSKGTNMTHTPEDIEKGIVIVDTITDTSKNEETIFGTRYGHDVFCLTQEHLDALRAGKMIALDCQMEYLVYLQADKDIK